MTENCKLGAGCCGAEPHREPSINREMSALYQQREVLYQNIQILVERLQRVLRPQEVKGCSKAPDRAELPCPLAESIALITYGLAYDTATISDLLDRLEI